MCIPYNNTKHNIQQIWVQQVKQRTSCIRRFTCSPEIPVPGSPSKPRRPGNPISPWMRPTGFIFHWNDTQQHCVYSNQISFLVFTDIRYESMTEDIFYVNVSDEECHDLWLITISIYWSWTFCCSHSCIFILKCFIQSYFSLICYQGERNPSWGLQNQ